MSPHDPIEAFMAAFSRSLRVARRRRPRIVEETEAHLRDAAEALVIDGTTEADAQRQAISRYGTPEGAAEEFGWSAMALVGRTVLRLWHRRPGHCRPAPETLFEPGLVVDPPPPPLCDVCCQEVAPADRLVVDLSALGDMAAPVTLLVHRACYDMAEAILALRGLPVTASHSRPGAGHP